VLDRDVLIKSQKNVNATSVSAMMNNHASVTTLLRPAAAFSPLFHAAIDRTKLEEEVEFKCKSKVESELEEIKDKIKFKIKSDERGLVVKVEYEQEIENEETDVEVETETKYEIVFARMVEYQKSANANARGDGAYDWENDVVVSEMPMLQWNPMVSNYMPLSPQRRSCPLTVPFLFYYCVKV
jgi:hypothetical protein